MAAIDNSNMAQITARSGVGRAGTMRAGVTFKTEEIKADATGEIIWDRDLPNDGNPDDTAASFTRVRD